MKRIDKRTRKIIEDSMRGLKGKLAAMEAKALSERFGISRDRIYASTRHCRPRRKPRSDRKILSFDQVDPDDPMMWAVGWI